MDSLVMDVLHLQTEFAHRGGIIPDGIICRFGKKALETLIRRAAVKKCGDSYVWMDADAIDTEKIIARRYGACVISSRSALYIYGYLKTKPSRWHISVEKGVREVRSAFDFPRVALRHVPHDMLFYAAAPRGEIFIASRERALCELIAECTKKDERSEVYEAICAYIMSGHADADALMLASRDMGVMKKVEMWILPWLVV